MKKKIIVIFVVCAIFLFLCLIIFNCAFPVKYKNYVDTYSEKYSLDSAFVLSIIKAESNFKNDAVSSSGALGLMQLMPKTAKWVSEQFNEEYSKQKMFEPKTNIKYGCFYLRYLFDKFNDFEIVVCAYNAGETKVYDWIEDGKINKDLISYEETRTYLKRVSDYYKIYSLK